MSIAFPKEFKETVAPLVISNIDTDMIIPKQHLKTLKRTGLGRVLFDEMRRDTKGNVIADFVLNQDRFKNAKILFSGENFGCGSSREHAPWALKGFGIRVIIAKSFADIFYNNCFKNGILPIALDKQSWEKINKYVTSANEAKKLKVNLQEQKITGEYELEVKFDLDSKKKEKLIKGMDDISETETVIEKIKEYEEKISYDNRSTGKTLYDKIYDLHEIKNEKGINLLYIDGQIVHEVTSPQAFEGIELAKRNVRHPERHLAVADHNTPTDGKWRKGGIIEAESKAQIDELAKNATKNGIELHTLGDETNGVCHVVGPEQGFTRPGMTIVCGDSHTSTHGAFGALAFGIGTSEVEHVMATQTLVMPKSKNMRVSVKGKPSKGFTAKDIVMAIIGKIGTAGGTGYVIEYAGEAIESLSIEGRMTVCNMSIEAGARAGLIAPDQTTIDYIKGKRLAPKGDEWTKAVEFYKHLKSDADAKFDKEVELDITGLAPQITWGTSPEDVSEVTAKTPKASDYKDESRRQSFLRALKYVNIAEDTQIAGTKIDKVFIGSCTNSRIEDFRAAAAILKGKKIASNITLAMAVPGSGLVKKQAEEEGLDKIFKDAGFEWRDPGCSMCLAMNNDRLTEGERCVSTSNRNFEGRQGRDGITHLASPITAAYCAIQGEIADVREVL